MKRTNAPVLTLLTICLVYQAIMAIPVPAQPLNLNIIAGDWARTDGNYTLRVRNVASDGSAEVAYFNPAVIQVAESRISTQEGLIKLYVKLQDTGYPGCTYTLFYYVEKDALTGYYYQAALDETFEVIFLRNEQE